MPRVFIRGVFYNIIIREGQVKIHTVIHVHVCIVFILMNAKVACEYSYLSLLPDPRSDWAGSDQ